MKMRVADYVAEFMIQKGISQVFSVVGGGSMYLNDAFGNCKGLKVTYNHHEQASTMAAEGYYKASGKIAGVCVTTGPGGTNTITGVLGAYQDSSPLFIVSGQVRYATTVESTGLNLRQFGGQEHQIIDTIRNVTKYACMIRSASEIKIELEKAFREAVTGRPGPVWIDIPLDIQGQEIETDELVGLDNAETNVDVEDYIKQIEEEIQKAKRPLFLVGAAIHIVEKQKEFIELMERYQIPAAFSIKVPDIVPKDHPLNAGCYGNVGSRAGNFAVQNADLLVVFGSRMTFWQTGFNFEKFSPNSRKVVIDIDEAEQNKPIILRDLKVTADLGSIIDGMLQSEIKPFKNENNWCDYITDLKRKYPIFQEKFNESERINPYYFAKKLYEQQDKDTVIVLGNSSGLDTILQTGIKEAGARVVFNRNCGSMGYCLPAGIGAYEAVKRPIHVVTGDGCIMMNIQELATISFHKMPIKIFIFNNGGYCGVVNTQNKFFQNRLCGCTKDSGIWMPPFRKIADAFEIKYQLLANHKQLDEQFDQIMNDQGPMVVEILQDLKQGIEPAASSKRDDSGNIVSTAIDDGYPFLSKEEYEACQFDQWSAGRNAF